MGNYVSKLLIYTTESRKECSEHQAVVQQATMEDNSMCTPVLSENRVLGDPRSASAGIRRTPIEVKCIPAGENKKTASAIPKYLQKKQYLETDMDVVMPPLTPKKHFIPKSVGSDKSDSVEAQDYLTPDVNIIKSSKVITSIDKERFIILGLDPRSPAADFDRTPILMPRSLALLKARSQEYLSRKGSYETDIYNPENSCQEIDTSLTSEIRLSDTPAENLEILDAEEQDVFPSTSPCDSDLSISKSEEEITVIKNPKCNPSEKEKLVSDEQTIAIDNEDKNETKKQDECKNIESNTKIRDDDKIKLSDDSLSSEENASGKKDKKELPREKSSREDVIISFDKCTTISTSLKPMKTEGDSRKKGDTKEKKKNTKMDVEEKVFTYQNKQGTEVHKNRTPLGNRSNIGQIQKKPKQLLINKATAIGTQKENTPPPKTYNGKMTRNGIQWDPNSTVLI